MLRKQAFISLIPVLSSFILCGTTEAGRQSLMSISLQAESFLESYIYASPYPPRFELSQLDKRLNLKSCDQPLVVKFSSLQKVMGNTSLTIACKAPVSWKIRLPVLIDIYDNIALSKTPLLKGQTIDSSNIRYRKTKVTSLHQGYFRKADSIDRLQAKRNLKANTILTSGNVAAKLLITSGQRVTILLKINGLQIKSTGLALQSATLGQRVKVRNTQSNKIVEGTVSSEGQITIRL